MWPVCFCSKEASAWIDSLGFETNGKYQRCSRCGSWALVNSTFNDSKGLEKYYGLDEYWYKKMRARKGGLTIDERTSNDLRDGRVACWLSMIEKYSPVKQGVVVEVGCAHAVLLRMLRDQGWQTTGMEPSSDTVLWIQKNCKGVGAVQGIFPEAERKLPRADLFLAMDVLEHALDPVAFAAGVKKVLNPGGIAILQCPMYDEVSGLWPPFTPRTLDAFDGEEHLWLYTRRACAELFMRTGLEIISNEERWVNMHEIIVLKKAAA